MKLERLAFGNAVTAEPHQSVRQVARQMQKSGVGSVVVVTRKKPLGIVTDRDIATWIARGGKDADGTHVGQIMSQWPLIASTDSELEPVVDQMAKKGVHRIPIVNRKNDVVGVLSFDNVIELVARYMRDLAEVVEKPKGKVRR
ncbi:MAG: CBS domain-containing protein [Bdellovibrionota bacterium]